MQHIIKQIQQRETNVDIVLHDSRLSTQKKKAHLKTGIVLKK